VPKKDDETRWLDKAEEAIGAAKSMKEPEAKASLLTIAKAYLKLAKHSREQAELRRKPKITN
jgi:hypothetical protein